MKKSFLILLATSLFSLAGCGGGENPNPNPPAPHQHADNNLDHKCDSCGLQMSDHQYKPTGLGTHECSICQEVKTCVDENHDHICEICGGKSEHDYAFIGDRSHKCDICGTEEKCVDNNGDDKCDFCGHSTVVVLNSYKYTLIGDAYKAQFTNGTQFGSDHTANVSKLIDFLNGQAETSIITSLDCVSCNSLDDTNKDGVRYFTIGSAKVGGSIVINTNVPVTKVSVKAVNYHNSYSDGSNTDYGAHLYIDKQDNSLELQEGETPVSKEFTCEYETPVNKFKLSTKDTEKCRVFIESITITFAN